MDPPSKKSKPQEPAAAAAAVAAPAAAVADGDGKADGKIRIIDNYINGVFVPPKSGKYLDVTCPHDGSVIAKVALSTAEDIADAVNHAARAYAKWSALTVKSRAAILMKIHYTINEHMDELADLVVLEHGKNKLEAMASIAKGNETIEWACSLPQLFGGKILEVSRGVECKEYREPIGVVASIVPFNFPFMVPMWTTPIAIGAGNTIILKPSEKVPITLSRVVELFKKAGLPDGVVNIINGAADAVNGLCDNPSIRAVTFVGSTKIAELVAARCHGVGKRVLALGGAKNHMVAVPDCNIEMCAQDIVNSFTGCSGQRCMAASVLLVVGKQEKLIRTIVEKAKTLTHGKADRQLGPVIDQAAVDRIIRYIDEAEQSGVKVLLDGRHWAKSIRPGFWVGPTILQHTRAEDPAMQDEIFGPVLSILEVKDEQEALRIENSSPYGNAACIYTSSGLTADYFSKRFGAAMIGVNIGVPVPREPFSFGGAKRSKFGEHDITADGGVEFFTQRRKVTTKWNPPAEQNWMS